MRVMPLREALRLPVIQTFALKAGLIATDPFIEDKPARGYIAQEIKQRTDQKMAALEREMKNETASHLEI
jgi:hypothetical protein